MPTSSSTDEPTARSALRKALFSPDTIALIGASADPARLTSRPQRVLRRQGYTGTIVPIHPMRSEIAGESAYRSIVAVPGRVEHAFVMVPRSAVPDVIADCCRARVEVATVVTAGFAETGDEGMRLQRSLVEMARAAGVRLLGPNCLGVVNVTDRVTLSANAVFEHEPLRPGGLSVVSQSGSMLGGIVTRAQERGLGFAKLISVGNESDLGVGELVDLLVDDPATEAILLFLEAFRDAQALGAAARRAFACGKPVVALKLGRSPLGREIATTHTGAMASADDVADAFFRAHGILRVEVFEALFEAPQLVLGHRPPKGKRVAALTVSGGAAAMVLDRLGLAGIEVVPPSAEIRAAAASRRIRISGEVLTDLPMGRADAGAYAAILEALMESEHCDAVVAIQGSNATHAPEVMNERILAARRGQKPLAVFAGPRAHAALDLLQRAGVAAFRTPEACADAVRAYCTWRMPSPAPVVDTASVAAVRAVFAGARPGMLDAFEASRLLAAIGIPCAPVQRIGNAGARVDLSYPLAAKILSPDIIHKTDIDAVILDIADHEALVKAVRALHERVRSRAPEVRIDGVLVQTMHYGIGELLVGYRRDSEAGPVVLVGAGGTAAELRRDHALRLAPVSVESALEMIAEAQGLAAIRGFRNRPAGDLQAIARVLHVLSLLACVESPGVLEAEINPLIVRIDGVVAVDARIRIAEAVDD